jgi:hypothetical protein
MVAGSSLSASENDRAEQSGRCQCARGSLLNENMFSLRNWLRLNTHSLTQEDVSPFFCDKIFRR